MDANGDGTHQSTPSGRLPSAVAARLRHLTREIPPVEIADLWIFPPLADLEGSSEFFLLTRLNGEEALRVYSARLPVGGSQNGNGRGDAHRSPAEQEIVEHGSVPADRLDRLVEGFRRRLGDDREPLHFAIGGCEASWTTLIEVEAALE